MVFMDKDKFIRGSEFHNIFNQQWPRPTKQVQFDPNTRKMVAFSEVERRQQYLDKLRGEAEILRPLVEECLDNDPAVRPTIAAVCEREDPSKQGCLHEGVPTRCHHSAPTNGAEG